MARSVSIAIPSLSSSPWIRGAPLYGAVDVKLEMSMPCLSLSIAAAERSEGSSPWGAEHRAATLYSVGPSDPHHDAAMRIGGEAPGGGPILESGLEARGALGSPPPRIVFGSGQHRGRQTPILTLVFSAHAARNTTPAGSSPVVTKRHNSTSSLRARATISVLRTLPPAPCATRPHAPACPPSRCRRR